MLLAFYFFKKQYEKQPISSIYLWEKTLQEWESDRWWNKLQRNILLLLQLLILLFLIMALMRPFVPGEGIQGEHLVIVMDSSASMEAEDRLSQVKKDASALIDNLGDDQVVSVIQAKESPKLVVSREENNGEAKRAIEQVDISYQHEHMEDSLQLAHSLLQGGNGEVHVYTDHLDQQDIDLEGPLVVHNREESLSNRSVKAFGVRQNGEHVSAILTVHNQSEESIDLPITILSEGEVLQEVREELPAGEERTWTLNNLPVRGYYQADIAQDAYQLDNEMYAFLPNDGPSSIYLAGNVNPFVQRALRSAGVDTVSVPQQDDGSYRFSQNEDAVYLLSGVKADSWPDGPKLILAPEQGGPFAFKEKQDLQYKMNPLQNDPLLQYSDVEQAYLGKAYGIGGLNGLEPIAQSGDKVVMAKGMYDGSPMFLLPFDVSDSDWPLHPGFPILLSNAVDYLAQEGQNLGYFDPRGQIELSLSTTTEEAVIEKLSGKNVAEVDVSEPFKPAPSKPGIYQLHEKTSNGSKYQYLAVQIPPEERLVDSASSFEVEGENGMSGMVSLSKQELWRWFAAIALLILFIEWEVYRRGLSSR